MIDDVMTLISRHADSYDQYGNPVTAQERKQIFCRVRSVSKSEFYQAAQSQLHPEIVFVITHKADYDGETIVEYKDELYDVLRTYWKGDVIELTAARRIGSYGGGHGVVSS